MMRYLLFGIAYIAGMALILAAGFFPVMVLAGHSGRFSGAAAALIWAVYGLAVLFGPWPAVSLLRRRSPVKP